MKEIENIRSTLLLRLSDELDSEEQFVKGAVMKVALGSKNFDDFHLAADFCEIHELIEEEKLMMMFCREKSWHLAKK